MVRIHEYFSNDSCLCKCPRYKTITEAFVECYGGGYKEQSDHRRTSTNDCGRVLTSRRGVTKLTVLTRVGATLSLDWKMQQYAV